MNELPSESKPSDLCKVIAALRGALEPHKSLNESEKVEALKLKSEIERLTKGSGGFSGVNDFFQNPQSGHVGSDNRLDRSQM